MSYILNMFLQLPIMIRVAIFLIIPFIVWIVLGKFNSEIISKIIALVPLIIRKLFQRLYLLIDIPIDFAHRKFGSSFYEIDNGVSRLGKKIDLKLGKWYHSWETSQRAYIGIGILLYCLCVIIVSLPSLTKIEEGALIKGAEIYLVCENRIIKWLDDHDLYNEVSNDSVAVEIWKDVKEKMDDNQFGENMIVTGVSSALLVRDIPSTEGSTTLARLRNNDVVTWSGQITFSEVNNNRVEAWVKVMTEDGVEGWSRLHYLRPEVYENIEYIVTKRH